MTENSTSTQAAEPGAPWWQDPITWAKVLAISVLGTVLFVTLNTPLEVDPGQRDLPHFELSTLGGVVISNESLVGRVGVLNFFATWCTPCKAEMPDLNRFASKQNTEEVMVIGVAAGNEHRLDIRPFVETYQVLYPIALDGERLFSQLGGNALPTTVIVDRTGRITRMVRGPVSEHWLEAEVARALAGHADDG